MTDAASAIEPAADGLAGDRMRRREFIGLLGGSAAWPLTARAQQHEHIARLGYLSIWSEGETLEQTHLVTFRQALRDLGWIEGRDVRIDYRFGDGDATAVRKLAKELIELRPDIIFARTSVAAIALREYTLSIPIVFVEIPDPVAAGLVTNLARPDGNITGFSNFEFSIGGKWLQVLKDFAPSISRTAVLFDPSIPSWTAYMRAIEAAAPSMGLELTPAGARDAAELESMLDAFAGAPNGALVVLPSPVTIVYRHRIISVTARHRLPAVYPYRFFTAAGGLMSYGVDLSDLDRRSASYVDKILKGAKPADLPVQQPTKFELVINVKTAKMLGLTIPQALLVSADELIE